MPKATAKEDNRVFGMGNAIVCAPGSAAGTMKHPDANPRCTCAVKAGRYIGNHHVPGCGAYAKGVVSSLAALERQLDEASEKAKSSAVAAAAPATN